MIHRIEIATRRGLRDARGEYGAIVERLLEEGFEIFAWDARSGGDRFGGTNRTVAGLASPSAGYCAAYPDLDAALHDSRRMDCEARHESSSSTAAQLSFFIER